MGDIADWLLASQDPFDCEDDEDETGGSYYRSFKTCRRCGKGGLSWVHTGERWALQEYTGRLHVCDTAASPDEFD